MMMVPVSKWLFIMCQFWKFLFLVFRMGWTWSTFWTDNNIRCTTSKCGAGSQFAAVLGPYRTCPWHFKCLNKIGRVELVPTFATIRFWHRTTTEHVQTGFRHSARSCQNTLGARTSCSREVSLSPRSTALQGNALWSYKRITRRDSATPITAPSTIFLDPSAAAYSWSPRFSNSDRKDLQLNPKRKAAVLIAW